ncbi:MAG TPA: hypothetical protein VFU06_09105 [Longimicrobiales bacterium]|nr:hypothetical protein [Longimicrobiales bacterium]
MFELIGLLAAGTAAGFGYIRSRAFVSHRLRYVDAAHRPSAPVIAGLAATAIATPVVWALPIVGAGTALVFGAAVGLGTRAGAKETELA